MSKEKEEEKNKRYKIKLYLNSGVSEMDDYLNSVKNHFVEFGTTEIFKDLEGLIKSSERLANTVFSITSHEDTEVTELTKEKAQEIFGKLMEIVNNTKKTVELYAESQECIKVIEEALEGVKGEKQDVNRAENIFEQIQEKHFNKNKGKR